MIRFTKILTLASLTLLSTAVLATTVPTNSQPINRIVAIVNNTPITQTQVNEMISAAPQGQAPSQAMAVQALINQTLQTDIAKKAGITASAADVTQAINHIAASNHITVAQLKSKVTPTMSWEKYRHQIHQQLLLSKIQQTALAGKVNISATAVKNFIKNHADQLGVQTTYQYSDLLIPTSDKVSSAQATNYAKQIIKQWQPGVELATLEQKLPATANASMLATNQKDTPDNIADVFLAALNKLPAGHLSQPIVTGNGVHVLQLDQKNMASYQEQQQRATAILSQQAYMKAIKSWVQGLRKSAYVKVLVPADQ